MHNTQRYAADTYGCYAYFGSISAKKINDGERGHLLLQCDFVAPGDDRAAMMAIKENLLRLLMRLNQQGVNVVGEMLIKNIIETYALVSDKRGEWYERMKRGPLVPCTHAVDLKDKRRPEELVVSEDEELQRAIAMSFLES